MKLHLFAAAAAALLCAAPIAVSADADVLELNNLDFEEQKDSLLLDNFISESEGSEIRVRMGKAEGPSPSTRRPRNKNTRRPRNSNTRRPTGRNPTRRPTDREGKATSRPTRRPTDREGKATSRPTRRPRGRSTRRPTRRPNRRHNSDRRIIRELTNHNWRFDQCARRGRMSSICEDLDCHICSQGRRNISRRMENVCERVGLPFRHQRNRCGNGSRRVREAEEEIMAYAAEESDSMKSEDMDMDMEVEEVEVGVSESKDEFDSIESEDTEFVSAAKATKAPRDDKGDRKASKATKSTRRGISMSIISRSGKSGKGDKMAVVFASE